MKSVLICVGALAVGLALGFSVMMYGNADCTDNGDSGSVKASDSKESARKNRSSSKKKSYGPFDAELKDLGY